MPDPLGYQEWGSDFPNVLHHPAGTGFLYPDVDGERVEPFDVRDIQLAAGGRGGLLESAGGTSVHQAHWVRAQQPLNAWPRVGSFSVLGVSAAAHELWLGLQGRVAKVFLGWYEKDRWSILGAAGSQEVWQLSREVAWANVTDVTSSTHPGKAMLDATEQTIDYSPTPTDPTVAGNVYVLDRDNSGGEPDAIQTRKVSDIGGTYLTLRYPAVHRLRIESVSYSVPSPNGLLWRVAFRELLPGTYTAIDPGPDVILDASAL